MASVVASMTQNVFAGLAFAGSGYLFKMVDKINYEVEIKRHNKALEDLAKAKEAFYENGVKQRDKIQELKQELADANNYIENTNRALDMLRKVQTVEYNNMKFDREPKLSDFYQPSNEMKEYQFITTGIIGICSGYLLSKIL